MLKRSSPHLLFPLAATWILGAGRCPPQGQVDDVEEICDMMGGCSGEGLDPTDGTPGSDDSGAGDNTEEDGGGASAGDGSAPADDAPAPQGLVPGSEEHRLQFEAEVLARVNALRAAGADCGVQGVFDPTHPVVFDEQLRAAARAHAQDMAARDFFSHTNPDGVDPAGRMLAAGYTGSPTGENLAGGYADPEAVVEAWKNSPGHCAGMLDATSNELGVGFLSAPGSTYGTYWVQNFGRGPPVDG